MDGESRIDSEVDSMHHDAYQKEWLITFREKIVGLDGLEMTKSNRRQSRTEKILNRHQVMKI